MQCHGKCNAKFCTVTNAKLGDNFQNPEMREDDREREQTFFFQDKGCGGTVSCLSFVDPSAI